MVARPIAPTEEAGPKYRLSRLTSFGAKPLGIDEAASTIWIRRRFAVPPVLT
jgi:hypothetical protein